MLGGVAIFGMVFTRFSRGERSAQWTDFRLDAGPDGGVCRAESLYMEVGRL